MFVLLLILRLSAVGSVIVALPVAVQPLLSVILYEYVPAAKLLGL
jgi:hypothetical protein